MKTRKPLREMVPEILSYVKMNLPTLQYNNRLLLVHEGQLRKEIEDSLAAELSKTALAKAIKRVPSINLLIRIIDKLSRVYTDPAKRETSEKTDLELLRFYESQLDLTKVMPTANKMLNLHKCCALEPYMSEDGPALRVLPASRFLVYSDCIDDPMTPTVFIKTMGGEWKTRTIPLTNSDGGKTVTNEPYWVDIYYLYSDDEIIFVDSDGDYTAYEDRMLSMGMDGSNPIGKIPFVYANKSEFFLMPLPDTDTLDNTILIPKLLADLNYAVQFQSHSITVATDIELPSDVPWNPDVIINAKTDENAKQQGSISTIKPSVDIEQVLLLIETTIAFWLEARNIKTTSVVGKVTAESASSGIAKIIDEADATQDRRGQMTLFQCIEEKLWELVSLMHEYWKANGMVEAVGDFSEDFSVGIKYANMLPVQSEKDETDIVKSQLESGLINKRMAVERLNPHFGPKEIDDLMQKIGGGDLSLTGTQFKSLVELISAVTARQIPRDTAVNLISQAFSVPPGAADLMLGSAGKGVTNVQVSPPTGASGQANADFAPIQPKEGGGTDSPPSEGQGTRGLRTQGAARE